ncbi:membrane-spanning 4-domains subfamily A member 8-like [Engystomops pustulosus]|uniref:membrane-spanning 4-domains subfamily A member 8-like n=1 Tax=Engystomops pustulosus TaxID=76066 RepID=UPI003AFA79F4
MMSSSPSNGAGAQNYQAIPISCDISPQQHLHPYSAAVTENSNAPQVHLVHLVNQPTPVPPQSVGISLPQKTPSLVVHPTKGLVILLIVAGAVQFILGIGMLFTHIHYTLYSGVPFWGLVSYLVAAAFTISALKTTSLCVVKASLALNILNAIVSGVGVIMASLDIVVSTGCPLQTSDYHLCRGRKIGGIVVYSLLVINYLLLFSVSVSLAVYGCRSLDPAPSQPQVYLVQNMVVPASSTVNAQLPSYCDHPVEGRR